MSGPQFVEYRTPRPLPAAHVRAARLQAAAHARGRADLADLLAMLGLRDRPAA